MSDIRLCAACGDPVSVMRRGLYCSRDCATGVGKVLVHSCLSNTFDPPLLKCHCKYRVSRPAAKEMIDHGEAVGFTTCEETFDGGPLLVKIALKTPRGATIEKNHILAGVGIVEGKKLDAEAHNSCQVKRLKQAMEEDEAARAEEVRLRWDLYAELDRAMWNELTVPEVSDGWGEGRCLFSNSWEDERSSVGKDAASLY